MLPNGNIFQETPKYSDNHGGPGRMVLFTKGLTKAFGGQTVLDRVSLELYNGEVVLLRGDNGSGKTTLLNILTGNLEPDSGYIQFFTNGKKEEFRFHKRWWRRLSPTSSLRRPASNTTVFSSCSNRSTNSFHRVRS